MSQNVSIELGRYTALDKGFLKGFFNVMFTFPGGIQLQVHDCSHFSKEGRDWVSFPARQYEKKDGTKSYSSYVRFPMKEQERDLTNQILEAIKSQGSHGNSAQANTNQVQDESPFVW